MQKSTRAESLRKTRSARRAHITVYGAAVIISVALLVWAGLPTVQYHEIEIANQSVAVEIADTPQLRERGLSGKESLPDNEGMLFVFDKPGLYHFYMKDMNFAIDIIWMNSEKRVVDMVESVSPDTYPQTFGPGSMSQYVLEVPAGFVEEHNVQRGMQAHLDSPDATSPL